MKTNKLILSTGQEVDIGTSTPKFIGGYLCKYVNGELMPIYKNSEIRRIIINTREE